ncbi:MAG: hypothetical protein JW874_08630 [Spirochaetales bacterium]|nr:hypothetical protein [Spirochaetales bacterium]
MDIPASSDVRWQKVIRGDKAYDFTLLGTKIIVGRLAVVYKLDPKEATMEKCVGDLVNFFEKNKEMPKARTDLAQILG